MIGIHVPSKPSLSVPKVPATEPATETAGFKYQYLKRKQRGFRDSVEPSITALKHRREQE